MSQFINDTKKLVFLGAETRTSKAGNPYTIVTVADTEKYQRHQLFKADTAHVDGLKINQTVKCVLSLESEGFNQRIALAHIEAI